MASGADGAVISTHKVLGAFTQSAVLNLRGSRVPFGKVEAAVGMSQTTSPAAFILATIDACRRNMALNGRAMLDRTINLANDARERLHAIPGVSVLDESTLGTRHFDQTKLVVDVHGLGLTGFEVEDLLRTNHRINPEMSDTSGIICLITVGDTAASIDRLIAAFESIARDRAGALPSNGHVGGAGMRSSGAVIAPGIQAMSPREAFFADARAIPLNECSWSDFGRTRHFLSAGNPGARSRGCHHARKARLSSGGIPTWHVYLWSRRSPSRNNPGGRRFSPQRLDAKSTLFEPGATTLTLQFRASSKSGNGAKRRPASARVSSFFAKQKRAWSGAVVGST